MGLVAGNRRRYGGYVVHLGILLLFCGITGSSVFATQRIVTLSPGEAAAVGEYRIRFDGLTQATRAGALSIGAQLRVFEGARDLGAFAARRNLYLTTNDSTTDVVLRSTPRDDLYVTLVGWTQDGRATIRLLVNPLVSWMWVGGLVLTAGAVLAMIPERRPALQDVPGPRGGLESGPAVIAARARRPGARDRGVRARTARAARDRTGVGDRGRPAGPRAGDGVPGAQGPRDGQGDGQGRRGGLRGAPRPL